MGDTALPDNGWPADRIDTKNAHSARIYDYILGGKDYYPADKEAGDAMSREWPALPIHMRANRDWMNRAVRWLAEEAGMRQFLDVGTGIPTSPNLHEIAQAVAPESRVVYVDNDPIVLTLSQGLLASTPRAGPPTSRPTSATRAASWTPPNCARPSTSPSRWRSP
ncbi:hypothetical protein GCM10020295_11200 [Streptomyces cinereospinus]